MSSPKKIKFVLFRGKNRRWYFHVVAGNGKLIADSTQHKGYHRLGAAIRTCDRIRLMAATAALIVRQ